MWLWLGLSASYWQRFAIGATALADQKVESSRANRLSLLCAEADSPLAIRSSAG